MGRGMVYKLVLVIRGIIIDSFISIIKLRVVIGNFVLFIVVNEDFERFFIFLFEYLIGEFLEIVRFMLVIGGVIGLCFLELILG